MTAHRRVPMSLKSALPIFALLYACDDGATVVALNVSFAPTANTTHTVAVTISQSGQSPVDTMLTIPSKESDAGPVVKDSKFVQRITLPAGYTEADTTITAVAKDASGATLDTATATISPRPKEAIAAFVTVGEEPAKEPTKGEGDAGTEDASTAEGAAGATVARGAAGASDAAGAGGAAGAAGK
jgi:hypothetical protein